MKKKDSEQIYTGLYSYLRTAVQYKPLPARAPPSTSARSPARPSASATFELEQNPEKKKLFHGLQRDRTEQLQREFPNSPYLRQI